MSDEPTIPAPTHLPFSTPRRMTLCQRIRALYGGPKASNQLRDRRIRHLAAVIEATPDNWRVIQAGIRGTGLSCAYLSVRFKEEANMPMRSYALWLKFEHACLMVLAGTSPRQAALDAGFADQSHLGRAARRFARKSFGQVQAELHRINRDLDDATEASRHPGETRSNLRTLRVAS